MKKGSRPTEDDLRWARAFVNGVKELQSTEEQVIEALAHHVARIRYEEWFRCTHEEPRTAAAIPPTSSAKDEKT